MTARSKGLCGTHVLYRVRRNHLSFNMKRFLKARLPHSNGESKCEKLLCQGAAPQNIVPSIRGPANESRNGNKANKATASQQLNPPRPQEAAQTGWNGPIEYTEIDNVKEFARGKWNRGAQSRSFDVAEFAAYAASKNKRRLRRLAQKGRCYEDQAEEDPVEDILAELQTNMPDTSSTILQMVAVQVAFIINICACDNVTQFSAATLQMVVSVATAHPSLVQSAFSMVDGWFLPAKTPSEETELGLELMPLNKEENAEEPADVEDQADPWYVELKGHLLNVKEGAVMYTSIPVWKQLSRCFVLASLIGMIPDKVEDTSSYLQQGLYYWSKNAASEMKTESYFEMILETLIFSCDFINSVVTSDYQTILSPSDLQIRTSNLLSLLVPFKNGTLDTHDYTEGRYQAEVHQAVVDLKTFTKNLPFGQAKNVFSGLLAKMISCEMTIKQTMANVKMRPAAPIVVLYGGSHVGKSGVMYMVSDFIAKTLGFEAKDENFWYKQKGDSFDSGMTGLKTVLFIDDADAEKSNKKDKTSTADLIRFSNLIPYQSLQAEVDAKGVIPFNHKLTVISTNSIDLGVLDEYKTPEAAFNRAYFYKVDVKPEFATDGKIDFTKVKPTEDGALAANVHEFTPYSFRKTESNGVIRRNDGFQPVFEEKKLDSREFLLHLRDRILEKQRSGETYVTQIEKLREVPICKACGQYKRIGFCTCVEDQALGLRNLNFNAPTQQIIGWWISILPDVHFTSALASFTGAYYANRAIDVYASCWLKVLAWHLNFLRGKMLLATWFFIPFVCNFFAVFFPGRFYSRIIGLLWFLTTWLMVGQIKKRYVGLLVEQMLREGTSSPIRIAMRTAGIAVSASMAITGLWSVRHLITHMMTVNQGNLVPKDSSDIEQRCSEKNPWLDVRSEDVPEALDARVKNMTTDQIVRKVETNVVRVDGTSDKGNTGTCGVMVSNNLLLVPKHAFSMWDITKTLQIRRHANLVGGLFRGVRVAAWTDCDTDLVMILTAQNYAFNDLRLLFPESYYPLTGAARMISRDPEGKLETRTLFYSPQASVKNASFSGEGSYHKCDKPTRKGLCGSPILLDGNPKYLIGFHCGGSIMARCQAVAFSVSGSKIQSSIDKLRGFSNEAETIPLPAFHTGPILAQYEKCNVHLKNDLSDRDCVRWTPEPTELHPHTVQVFGSDPSMRFQRHSEVLTTLLSKHMEAYGMPQKWGPPKFNVNRNHSAAYQNITHPSTNIPLSDLDIVVKDYKSDICAELRRLGVRLKPLTDYEMINGIEGQRFVRRMAMKTSSGLGLAGRKLQHFDESIIEDTGYKVYTMKDYVRAEFDRCEDLLRKGLVLDFVFKTALKDEPTKLTKDKVRVFLVAPLTMTMLIRKYMLPILNVLFYFPLATEMCQGVNATNREWHQLGEYLASFSNDCLEGDFSSWDACMSGQLMRTVTSILAHIAREFGYTQQEVEIVKSLGVSVSSKYILWNGTLIHLDSFMPSGVPITITMNGIGNALLHRIAYLYTMRKHGVSDEQFCFRKKARMLFVGDDSIGSSRDVRFNMAECQRVFASIGMKYTDGRKNQVAVDYFPFNEIQFCKRKFRYSEELGRYVAPIDVESIFKSLHCYMRSATPELNIVVGNIQCALRELARHDESTFAEISANLQLACGGAAIHHYVDSLYWRYAYWIDVFLKEDEPSSSTGTQSSETATPSVSGVTEIFVDGETDISGSVSSMGSLD